MNFDISLFQIVYGFTHRSVALDILGIFLAQYLPYLLVLVTLLFLAVRENWRARFRKFTLVALSVIVARGIVLTIIRMVFARPRPPVTLPVEPLVNLPADPGFPSGHATFFFALAFAIFLLNRRLGTWMLLGAVLVSTARVFVGVHYPLDVLTGALIGAISAYLVDRLLPKAEPAV
jgi:undecaprenyl-diphosphatase